MTVDVTKRHACHAKCRGDHGFHRTPARHQSPAQCHKWRACHAKRRTMLPSPTLTMKIEGRCRQVPRLPRKTNVDVAKRHFYHTERRSMSSSATLATQRAAATTASTGPKRVTRASPVPKVPRLPRKTEADVRQATQNDGRCHQAPRLMQRAAATTASTGPNRVTRASPVP